MGIHDEQLLLDCVGREALDDVVHGLPLDRQQDIHAVAIASVGQAQHLAQVVLAIGSQRFAMHQFALVE